MAKVFDEAVVAELNALYKNGMVGVGAQYEALIDFAKEKTCLTDDQIKVSNYVIIIIIIIIIYHNYNLYITT